MSEQLNTSKCRGCGQLVFWQTAKSGKKYPTDSERRNDFHQCNAKAQPAAPKAQAVPKPQPVSDVERRLQWLESEVRGLLIKLDSLGLGQ